jgi:hypothetical protein
MCRGLKAATARGFVCLNGGIAYAPLSCSSPDFLTKIACGKGLDR